MRWVNTRQVAWRFSSIAGALALLAALVGDTGTAHAAPPHGATIERDFECGLSEGGGDLVTTDSGRIKVFTPSGRNMLLCIDPAVEPAGDGAEIYDYASTGETCGIQLADGTVEHTERWRNVVTPSGISIQTCHSANAGNGGGGPPAHAPAKGRR